MNRKAITLLVLAHALLFAAFATRTGEVAWLAAPVLTLLLTGLFRAPRAQSLRFRAIRHVERDGSGAVAVTVRVRNEGADPMPLRLHDEPRPPVLLATGASTLRTLLAPGEEVELAYAFRVPRGRFVWSAVEAVASDPLGLLEEPLELRAPAKHHVHPELVRFHPLPLRPRRTLPSPGSVPARVGGSGIEFFGVREYQMGDSLRWLDWRHAARHPGRLFTREFEQEQIADIGLVLDACVGNGTVEGESLFEHAVRATASLAGTFIHQGHRVSLLVTGEPVARVFPGFGRVQLERILNCLSGARAPVGSVRHGLPESLVRLFPASSLLIVLSSLTLGETPLWMRLRAHGRQVVLVSPDPIDFCARTAPRDPLGRIAIRAARVERQLALRAVAELRIPVIDWRVNEALYPLLRSALRSGQSPRAS